GIRDLIVTGVQTCALPIYTDRARARSNVEDIINARPDVNMVVGLWSYNGPSIAAAIDALNKKGKVLAAVFDEDDGTLNGIASGRSEERRVGKEGRSWGGT